MKIPKELLYTKTHEWLRVEGENAYIGITDYAQHHLGDIVFVEIPEIDAEMGAEDSIAVIESVKAVSSVYTPISGTVLKANEDLESSPELLNEDPYDNWLAVISIDDNSELDKLISDEEYSDYCNQLED